MMPLANEGVVLIPQDALLIASGYVVGISLLLVIVGDKDGVAGDESLRYRDNGADVRPAATTTRMTWPTSVCRLCVSDRYPNPTW